MKKLITLSLVASALVANEVELAPLEVTSSSYAKETELSSTDSVEIYTAKDIEASHAIDIYKFLNTQTSMSTTPNYGNTIMQSIDLRGYGLSTGYQNVVIKVDGRRINNIDMVPQMLSAIAISDIERIEIIKGGGVVESGDGAMAGVLNITTKKGSNNSSLSISGGSFGTHKESAIINHSNDDYSISTYLQNLHTDGTRYISADKKDSTNLTNGKIALSVNATDKLKVRTNFAFAKANINYAAPLTKAQYDQAPSQAGNYFTNQEYDTVNGGFGATYEIDSTLIFNIDAAREKKKSNYTAWNSISDYTYDSINTDLAYENENLFVKGGIDLFNGERQSSSTTSKNNLAGYIMSRFDRGSNNFKAGVRVEQVSYKNTSATTTAKNEDKTLYGAELGYNYELDKSSSLFVNYEHAYQAPDIDRFYKNGDFNSFIEPSIADTINIGFSKFVNNNTLKATIFYTKLKDEIYYYNLGGFSSALNTNIDNSHKYGLELYDHYVINSEFNIDANYNYINATIDSEDQDGRDLAGKALPGVSPHNLKLMLNYLPTNDMTLALSHNYRSEAYAADDFENNFAQKQDAYNSTNFSFTYSKKSYELFVNIDNIFNQSNGVWIKDDAIYPVNFTTSVTAGLTLKY
ncbi:MAG: TonB-dependent receptor [Helicobacteraceae bacterium]|nr:TonB-dependent receptor [Helicobacteraceae bacterium]